jgi:hypothetical protein
MAFHITRCPTQSQWGAASVLRLFTYSAAASALRRHRAVVGVGGLQTNANLKAGGP